MKQGFWFAYGRRERLAPLERLTSGLANDHSLSWRSEAPDLLVVTVHDSLTSNVADVVIGINSAPHVALEARELADAYRAGLIPLDPGVPPPDEGALAQADARIEMSWDLRFSDETYNTMAVIAGLLAETSGAVVYDVTNRRFV